MIEPGEIRKIVTEAVISYSRDFRDRHLAERDSPDGTLNMKIHNTFVAELGDEIRFYNALSRSLDSSLGNMIEAMALSIAAVNFKVSRQVAGPLFADQTTFIATLLEQYKRNARKPKVSDYQEIRQLNRGGKAEKRHDSDYFLTDRESGEMSLVELKIGGDLDNKKARSEKEALLEQYAILSNVSPPNSTIRLIFATAYNRFGDGKPWNQTRVLQFFAVDELKVGRDFWNFVCRRSDGFEIVVDAYRGAKSHLIEALGTIRKSYLA
jgi:hypothetical protein